MPLSVRVFAFALPTSFRKPLPQARHFISICRQRPHELSRPCSPAYNIASRRPIFTSSQHKNAQDTTSPRTSAPSPPSPPRPTPAPAAQPTTTVKPGTTTLTSGLSDEPIKLAEEDPSAVDWTSSFHGLSVEPFSKEAADILLAPLSLEDVEIKPDGIIYLPEIKYRRILNRAFGPGGWGLAPRGESIVTSKAVTREYALLAHGRLVSIARGEQDYFTPEGIPTAAEGCKSNAMMRCCKDLGVASELWDPRFIRKFKAEKTREVFVEHAVSKKKSKIWVRKGDAISYPWKETKFGG